MLNERQSGQSDGGRKDGASCSSAPCCVMTKAGSLLMKDATSSRCFGGGETQESSVDQLQRRDEKRTAKLGRGIALCAAAGSRFVKDTGAGLPGSELMASSADRRCWRWR